MKSIIDQIKNILACLGVVLPKNVTETVIAQVNCPGKTIDDFISSSPIGLRKGPIVDMGSGKSMISMSALEFSFSYMCLCSD